MRWWWLSVSLLMALWLAVPAEGAFERERLAPAAIALGGAGAAGPDEPTLEVLNPAALELLLMGQRWPPLVLLGSGNFKSNHCGVRG
ncbi:MAG: hypothetical protein KatS3mg115_2167 [Candidatus Poribacteria bacterium]|nr:MAG: hypothetical protein KatS3mg115_2167 [Candidatus Poribacteria bacterium]